MTFNTYAFKNFPFNSFRVQQCFSGVFFWSATNHSAAKSVAAASFEINAFRGGLS